MKKINTGGIGFLEPLPGAGRDWYCGISRDQGDLYEAEEIFRAGEGPVSNRMVLVRYPEGEVFCPVPDREGTYIDSPLYLKGTIFFLAVDFPESVIRIHAFDAFSLQDRVIREMDLRSVRNCYNLMLHAEPLCLTRQGDEDVFEILWPERTSFPLAPHESFFLREGDRLFFSRWQEEGEGRSYRYWEETIVRDLEGQVLEVLPGDVMRMPDGSLWHIS